ncbi:MAG: peptidyl-tRNA hydrolase Pth2 [Candidatus Methanofastidiosa archaeon]|jgi:PTH2 family peptidyl-tRNA hydrolase|nr:peptidyl-tRNA hydrolase Pth2 [Candidatus Methanofastidiosa archaeon]MDD4281856.1 peptidyl-tRNA hydrolase Pth2 [Candidatus Methanofastidiosa archaeon]
MSFEYKMVILARRDLKLSRGKLAVQVAHAAVTCALRAKEANKDWFSHWVDEGQKKVVLSVDDKTHMIRYFMIAKTHGLTVCMIQDAGLTEVAPGTTTVCGIGPAPEQEIDRITGDLKLL